MKGEKKEFKLVIFDFDGTIADSFEVCFGTIDNIFRKRGWPALSRKAKKQARELSAKELFDYFEIPKYKLVFLIRKIFDEMEKNYGEVNIFRGIKTTLEDIEKNNIKIALLTSNNKKSVEKFFKKYKLTDFFEEVHYRSGLFSKHLIINRIIKKFKLRKSEVIMIGDEIRDIEAAQKSEIKMIAVAWGYNTQEALKKHNPDYLITKPSQIKEILIKK